MECACERNDGQPFFASTLHLCMYIILCVCVYSYKRYDEFWSLSFKLRRSNSRRILRTVMMNIRVYE